MENPADQPLPGEQYRRNPWQPTRRFWTWQRLILLVVAAFCVAVSVFFPLFGRAREPASRIKCASNLRQIGIACDTYARNHAGHYPDSLAAVMVDQDLNPAVFVCPSTNDTPPDDGPATQPLLADFAKPGHCSYVYVGNGLTLDKADAGIVIAYEPLSNHRDQGMNVLFGDGTVDWIESTAAQSILKQAASGVRPVRSSTTVPSTP